MIVSSIERGRSLFRWLGARLYGGAMILAYHRIAYSSETTGDLCVSPENFVEQLRDLRRFAHPICLSDVVEHLKDDSLPEKSVAITFDDGYADNLYTAKPLLEQYEIPATVFISTGYLGREFWWDELDRLVTNSQTDLGSLSLRVGSAWPQWRAPRQSDEPVSAPARRAYSHALYRFLLKLDPHDRDSAMDLIRSWSEGLSPDNSAARAMSEEELLRLVDGGLIEVGAHTRNHPVLPQLSAQGQEDEIGASKTDLETILGRKILGFSYPNGLATAGTRRLVRELGFAYACSGRRDVVRRGSDVYELTRFWQEDVNAGRFAKRLDRWLS
jgi:peptidoglycan/xylan/chitin deacetylase (PgdA/CDA1 family)